MTDTAEPRNATAATLQELLARLENTYGCGDFYEGLFMARSTVESMLELEQEHGDPDPVELLPRGAWTPAKSATAFRLGWTTPPTS